jgi:hypothetical protein
MDGRASPAVAQRANGLVAELLLTPPDILRHNGAPLGKRDFMGRSNLQG